MLIDMLNALRDAKTKEEKEKAYKDLYKLGMDKNTADVLLKNVALEGLKHG